MSSPNIYEQGLDKNKANYTPLTPLTFIERTAYIYPDRLAVVHGARRYTWGESFARAPPCVGARPARHRQGRHGRGDAQQHA